VTVDANHTLRRRELSCSLLKSRAIDLANRRFGSRSRPIGRGNRRIKSHRLTEPPADVLGGDSILLAAISMRGFVAHETVDAPNERL
jgi:hypothetical protein